MHIYNIQLVQSAFYTWVFHVCELVQALLYYGARWPDSELARSKSAIRPHVCGGIIINNAVYLLSRYSAIQPKIIFLFQENKINKLAWLTNDYRPMHQERVTFS